MIKNILLKCLLFIVVGIVSFILAAILGAGLANATSTVNMVFVGDVLPHNKAEKVMKTGRSPFGDFSEELKTADISIGNLECVVSSLGTPVENMHTFRASPKILPILNKHFTAMSVANNHSMDYGASAFLDMMVSSRIEGLQLFGGGHNLKSAHEPLIIRKNGKIIVVLAYNIILPRSFEALHGQAGVAWLDEDHVYHTIYDIKRNIKPDFLIIMPHWGIEEQLTPTAKQQTLARKLIDMGVDAIIGSHPHVTQGHEIHNGKLIVYSLGNFLFDKYSPSNIETRKSWLLKLKLDADNKLTWQIINVYLDKDGFPKKGQ